MNAAQSLVKKMFEHHFERIEIEVRRERDLSSHIPFRNLSPETRRLILSHRRLVREAEAAKMELEKRGFSGDVERNDAGEIVAAEKSYSARRTEKEAITRRAPGQKLAEIRNRAMTKLIALRGPDKIKTYLVRVEAEMAAVRV